MTRDSLGSAAQYAKSGITRNVKTSILRYLRMKRIRRTGDVEDASKKNGKTKKNVQVYKSYTES